MRLIELEDFILALMDHGSKINTMLKKIYEKGKCLIYMCNSLWLGEEVKYMELFGIECEDWV